MSKLEDAETELRHAKIAVIEAEENQRRALAGMTRSIREAQEAELALREAQNLHLPCHICGAESEQKCLDVGNWTHTLRPRATRA